MDQISGLNKNLNFQNKTFFLIKLFLFLSFKFNRYILCEF